MKRTAFDIDGVLCDLVSSMLKILKEKHGQIVKYENIKEFDLEKSFRIDSKSINNLIDESIQDYENLLPYDGTVEFLTEYQKEHKNILVITHRKLENDVYTRCWFEKFFPLIDVERIQIAYHHDKIVPLKYFGINQMVEDRAEVAISLAIKGIKVFLMDRPWNQFNNESSYIIRVKSWKDIKNYANK